MKPTLTANVLPASSAGLPDEYYIFFTIKELSEAWKGNINNIAYFQTIGILKSVFGQFYITDVTPPHTETKIKIKVSHYEEELKSTVAPYPVQLFGFIKWKDEPHFYAVIIKELPISLAIRLRNASYSVTRAHLVPPVIAEENKEFEEIYSDLSDESDNIDR